MWGAAFTVSVALALGACGGEEPAASGEAPDTADAVIAAAGGKADSLVSECELQAMLDLVNDEQVDDEALKARGVHTRAARNIVAYRDEDVIDTLQELDDIKYVGPVAFEQLLEASGGCQVDDDVEASVIFSPQPSDRTHLIRVASEIDAAERSLDIAVYSFRDSGIQSAIARAIARGVKVRMIFEKANEDRKDPEGSASARLEELGVDVRYVNKIMHHKFVIIDGPRDELAHADDATLISGSANWSSSAGTRYDENTVFIEGSRELNLRFQREFNHLWEHSRDFVWGEEKPWSLSSLAIEDDMIEDDPSVHAVFTSANFRTYFSSRYGETFSRVRGRDEVSDYIVSRIEQADTSIKIASGHLRSRPIAEALMTKRMTDPEVELQVYLDGQEYVSEFWHDKLQRDLDACLVEAGDSEAKQEDCIDKGFYFGIELHQVGIPTRYKYYSYRWHYRTAPQMHHKYLILDGETLIQGSYNLSSNAEHNTMENMAVFEGEAFDELVDAYEANFDAMWQTGRSEGLYDDLIDEIEAAEDTIPIIFDAMALDWQQVTDLKALIRDTCPAINSDEYRENPDRHFECEL